MKVQGTVVTCLDNTVRVLIEDGPDGERSVYLFPLEVWEGQKPPEEGQICIFNIPSGEGLPIIDRVIPPVPRLTPLQVDSIKDAQDVLGIAPGDKVCIVLCSISTPDVPTDVRHNLGWGEALGQRRIYPALTACGIIEDDIFSIFPEEKIDNPLAIFSNCHVVFLGSIRANVVLRECFWSIIEKELPISVPLDDGPARLIIKNDDQEKILFYNDLNPKPNDRDQSPHESIHIEDPFFVAVTENPYDSQKYHRCILLCGGDTFGTGYGSVIITAREILSKIADTINKTHQNRPNWWTAWLLNMKGMLNKENDRVTYVAGSVGDLSWGLPNAITSPTFWSSDCSCADDVILKKLKSYAK